MKFLLLIALILLPIHGGKRGPKLKYTPKRTRAVTSINELRPFSDLERDRMSAMLTSKVSKYVRHLPQVTSQRKLGTWKLEGQILTMRRTLQKLWRPLEIQQKTTGQILTRFA